MPKTKCKDCDVVAADKSQPYAKCEYHLKRYRYDWKKGNKQKVLDTRRMYYQKVKMEVLSHYTKGTFKCACCGENTPQFLTMDHIKNDGPIHRLEIRTRIHNWLRANNYPKGFQVLCFNCNMGKNINKGICPHKNITAKVN